MLGSARISRNGSSIIMTMRFFSKPSKYSKNIRIENIIPSILHTLQSESLKIKNACGITPTLALLHSHDHPQLKTSLSTLPSIGSLIGVDIKNITIPEGNYESMIKIVQDLNSDPSIHGISLQHADHTNVDNSSALDLYSSMSQVKDIDGRHPHNFAYLRTARELVLRTTKFRFDDIKYHVPYRAQALIELFDRLLVTIEGKNVLVLGSSSRASLEISLLLSKLHATVTVTNDHTADDSIAQSIKRSDIILLCDDIAIAKVKSYLASIRPEVVVVDMVADDASADSILAQDKEYIYQYYKPVNMIQCPDVLVSLMLLRNTIRSAERLIANPDSYHT